MPKFNDRIKVKSMCIVSHNTPKFKNYVIDLSIITDTNQYYEYEIKIVADTLTPMLCRRLRSIFADFQLFKNTDICVVDTMSEYHPFLQFLLIECQQIMCPIKMVSIHKIFKRIINRNVKFKKRTSNKKLETGIMTIKSMQYIWQKIIDHKKCNWITENYVTNIMQKLPKRKQRQKQLLRITTYYQQIKERLREH